MDLFDNLVLESFDFLLEGEQAEAYKKRKAEEKEAEENRYKSRHSKLDDDEMGVGSKYIRDPNVQKDIEGNDPVKKRAAMGKQVSDITRFTKSAAKIMKDYEKNPNRDPDDLITREQPKDVNAAIDAVNRHYRRHPKAESAFADIDML